MYCVSPRASVVGYFAEPSGLRSRLETYIIRHAVLVPTRLWNAPCEGSQAMLPAAAMTGSAASAGPAAAGLGAAAMASASDMDETSDEGQSGAAGTLQGVTSEGRNPPEPEGMGVESQARPGPVASLRDGAIPMHLSPTEVARLQIFQAAELARRNRERGILLNAPEAIAIACDAMHLAAREGGSIETVLDAGTASLRPDELMDGVGDLVAEIRLEVVLDEGTRLVVLRGLGGRPDDMQPDVRPGEVHAAQGEVTINESLETVELEVTNTSEHPVRVSSHFPFHRTNARLRFDREAARGTRLDIPAGDTVRWAPGEIRVVRLVRLPSGEGA